MSMSRWMDDPVAGPDWVFAILPVRGKFSNTEMLKNGPTP